MTPEEQFRRYQDLQRYVGWTEDEARLVAGAIDLLDPHLHLLVDDFYAEIDRHPNASRVITGGPAQVARLKGTLVQWLRDLLHGPYDRSYVERRWRVGWRHVEIGLDQVYTNMALSRLRRGLLAALDRDWKGEASGLVAVRLALNTLLDLDLAIIEDAYQAEYLARQQRVERLATIGQIGGGIAHEMRNPLNVIKTSVYYLLNARSPTQEKQADHLRRIERQVTLADGVITALSNYARMPIPELHPVVVRTIAQEVLTDYPPSDGVVVINEISDVLPAVLADTGQLKIVLGNLVRNACDAMPRGGKLILSGKTIIGHVELTVSDTGVGIPPELLGRVMEPLYTTKAKGLGLGLALARAILEKNQGSLHLTSQVGVGTTFTVRLTAADERSLT